jgi:hypothetical protein
MLIDSRSYYRCLSCWRQARQPYKKDARRDPTLTEHQLAKVLICRQEHVRLLISQVQHNVIRYAWLHFRDIPHGMTFPAQTFDDLAIYALVGKEIHPTASATG